MPAVPCCSPARSGDDVIRVPLTCMNEGLQRATTLGRVTNVVVS